ncbi:MAG: DUF1566 domain-containing protein, partial [Mariprofundus sp.]|nr:DUF1566 domain-containing protein [Mariprofundus sp.]
CVDTTNCDSEKFVAAVNAASLCGFIDWRMPDREDLRTIVDYGGGTPSIDTGYFPNTSAVDFWSSASDASNSGQVWAIMFGASGLDIFKAKATAQHLRLVRGSRK